MLSVLRTGLRYSRGQRPHAEDMDQMVTYLRRERGHGLPAVPTARRSKRRAIAAVVDSLVVIAYPMLSHGQPHHELGANYFDEGKKQTVGNQLLRRIQKLGHSVHVEPETTAAWPASGRTG